jgi:hypothetical protein
MIFDAGLGDTGQNQLSRVSYLVVPSPICKLNLLIYLIEERGSDYNFSMKTMRSDL